jgi:hypothetical protein
MSEEERRDWGIVEWWEEKFDRSEEMEKAEEKSDKPGRGNKGGTGEKGGVFEWIRLDEDLGWLCSIDFIDQTDTMWGTQLVKDQDVVAQSEVCYWRRGGGLGVAC